MDDHKNRLNGIGRHTRANVPLYLYEVPRIGKCIGQRAEQRLPGVGKWGHGELLFNGYRASVQGDKNILDGKCC